jgi:hypothetical protein
MTIKLDFDEDFVAREWLSKDGAKHNIYVKNSDGEVGWLDLKTGKFNNKSNKNYGFVPEENAVVKVHNGEQSLFIGLVDDDETVEENDARERLIDSISRFSSINQDGTTFELNLGPSREIRKGGKSSWAKANLSIKVENPEDIEALYDAVSDMASAMLDLETEKLLS